LKSNTWSQSLLQKSRNNAIGIQLPPQSTLQVEKQYNVTSPNLAKKKGKKEESKTR